MSASKAIRSINEGAKAQRGYLRSSSTAKDRRNVITDADCIDKYVVYPEQFDNPEQFKASSRLVRCREAFNGKKKRRYL